MNWRQAFEVEVGSGPGNSPKRQKKYQQWIDEVTAGTYTRFYDVKAKAWNITRTRVVGQACVERIDVIDNPMFWGVKTPADVKDVYDWFWNKFPTHPSEYVEVMSVKVA